MCPSRPVGHIVHYLHYILALLARFGSCFQMQDMQDATQTKVSWANSTGHNLMAAYRCFFDSLVVSSCFLYLSIRNVVLVTPAMCQIWAQAVAQRGDFCQSGVACCDMQTFVRIYNV